MPEFILSVPVGERVLRNPDGVEFVVESWERFTDGRIRVNGTDDDGFFRTAYLDALTTAPEGLKWEFDGSCRWNAFRSEDVYDKWTISHLYDTFDLQYAAGRTMARRKTFESAKAVVEEIEAVIARHKKEDARG